MTWKESDRERGTHKLETPEGEVSQDMERKRPSQGHSPTGDHIRREKLGHRKKVTGLQGNSHPGDRRGRDMSGQRKKATKQGVLTSWRPQREGQVKTWKESN